MWLWDYLYYKWRERNRAAGGFLDFGRVVFWMVACLVAGTLLGLDAMGGDTRAWKDLWFYAVVFLPAVACALWLRLVTLLCAMTLEESWSLELTCFMGSSMWLLLLCCWSYLSRER